MLNNKIINPTITEQDLPKQTLTKEEDALLKRIQELIPKQPVTPKQAQSVYPKTTLTSRPNNHTSLAAQVKRQFKNGTARHITNNIYRLTLSKQQPNMTRYDLEKELKVLNLKPKQIQYIEQTALGNIVINLTVNKYMIKQWIA